MAVFASTVLTYSLRIYLPQSVSPLSGVSPVTTPRSGCWPITSSFRPCFAPRKPSSNAGPWTGLALSWRPGFRSTSTRRSPWPTGSRTWPADAAARHRRDAVRHLGAVDQLRHRAANRGIKTQGAYQLVVTRCTWPSFSRSRIRIDELQRLQRMLLVILVSLQVQRIVNEERLLRQEASTKGTAPRAVPARPSRLLIGAPASPIHPHGSPCFAQPCASACIDGRLATIVRIFAAGRLPAAPHSVRDSPRNSCSVRLHTRN